MAEKQQRDEKIEPTIYTGEIEPGVLYAWYGSAGVFLGNMTIEEVEELALAMAEPDQ